MGTLKILLEPMPETEVMSQMIVRESILEVENTCSRKTKQTTHNLVEYLPKMQVCSYKSQKRNLKQKTGTLSIVKAAKR